MYTGKIISTTKKLAGILLVAVAIVSCSKEPIKNAEPELLKTFIPEKNKKFLYKIESDDSGPGTATQWISGEKDSSGITVFNLHTDIEASGSLMPMDNKIFSIKGKTYTEIKVPDAWYEYVALFGQMPNIKVTKAEVSGYPAYMVMENALKDGSIITTEGAPVQEQLIEYTNNGTPGSSHQEIVQITGSAKVETITVPAGSFVCNKFSYEVETRITAKIGDAQETGNGNEKITVWMAHGIGMVKQESDATLVTMVPLPTGEIKKIVTNSSSITTLQKIE
ncbi:MAG: hypothetical protein J0H29_18645 [Sphingobacteriales bacterium]|nr:hypothetical protein [Sphingobacteriales bacterium]OJY89588.1 MAG: hypothetical protein BGP14_21955 [Sphingobacteriales bacterium 44-15]